MFLSNVMEEQNQPYDQEQFQCDKKLPSPSSNITQNMIFPYTGPAGAGPGLLGSKPGAHKLDYLIALEHHASSLKSALTIAATLKNPKNKELDVEMVYDSICDIESELNNISSIKAYK